MQKKLEKNGLITALCLKAVMIEVTEKHVLISAGTKVDFEILLPCAETLPSEKIESVLGDTLVIKCNGKHLRTYRSMDAHVSYTAEINPLCEAGKDDI
jgi:hypothetical protein